MQRYAFSVGYALFYLFKVNKLTCGFSTFSGTVFFWRSIFHTNFPIWALLLLKLRKRIVIVLLIRALISILSLSAIHDFLCHLLHKKRHQKTHTNFKYVVKYNC